MKSTWANASCELCEIFHLNFWIPRDSCVFFSRPSFSAHYFQLSCDEFPCFCCFNITGDRSNSTFRWDWLAAMKSGCGHPWSHIKKCGFCTEQPNSCKMQEGYKVCFVYGKKRHFWKIHSLLYIHLFQRYVAFFVWQLNGALFAPYVCCVLSFRAWLSKPRKNCRAKIPWKNEGFKISPKAIG